MNPLIFTSFNDDIDPRFFYYQKRIMEKFDLLNIYKPLHYKWHHSEMLHGDILNMFVNKAFYEIGYDAILIVDVDAIPLSRFGIDIMFKHIYKDKLIGNAQRSHHIKNNEHVYAASSFIGFSEKTYRKLGRPNFLPSYDGDTAEQLTYNAEYLNVETILLLPSNIDSPNEKGEYWKLDDDLYKNCKYGIGTTFKLDEQEICYHLFGSRLNLFNDLFFNKCENLLFK